MKKLLIIMFLVIAIITVSACSTEVNPNELKVSRSSSDIVGDNYQTVISELKATGFTNITTIIMDDLIFGWLTKDGEIEKVEIGGNSEFSANDAFLKDAKIVITYHTFPKEETEDVSETVKPTDTVAPTNVTIATIAPTATVKAEEILTAKNNKDVATVFSLKTVSYTSFKKFAEKYAGRTIEFDGCVAFVLNHENYSTRFDYAMCVGDYNASKTLGPIFTFIDVNYYDFHFTGSNIPDKIDQGDNIHIKAIIGEYNEEGTYISLEPISTEIR
jgi:hypothetical protein